MSDDQKSAFADEMAERILQIMQGGEAPVKRKGWLMFYRWVVIIALTVGGAMATQVWLMVKGLISMPGRVESVSKDVAELKSSAAANDGRYVKVSEHQKLHDEETRRAEKSQEWSIQHGKDIQELKEFRAGALKQLESIERTVTRIDSKLDSGKG